MVSLVIISGRSGSGKSTALNLLEDMDYYCIDNLPVSLISSLIQRLHQTKTVSRVAVSIDARNIADDLANFDEVIKTIDPNKRQIVYLDAASPTLVKRFSETRRKHPLSNNERDLRAALEYETELLDNIASQADLTIDTTRLTIHELRDLIRSRITGKAKGLALLFQSFAFKNGVPVDADIVFDVRCLPNPHWEEKLKHLNGLDGPVREFLAKHSEVTDMMHDIQTFLERWLPKFEENSRSYVTVAIGCTGGQHRSVYLSDKLYLTFSQNMNNVQVRHRELGQSSGQPPSAPSSESSADLAS
ncbi:MAG: UPF0042 nucleotide-binding protein [Candidatus Azotimanducaceae bacterium]|jgi:UPF0042 nucleotide-binding protein